LVRLMNTWNWSGHNARSPRSRPAEEVIPQIAGEWDRRQGRDAHWLDLYMLVTADQGAPVPSRWRPGDPKGSLCNALATCTTRGQAPLAAMALPSRSRLTPAAPYSLLGDPCGSHARACLGATRCLLSR
jgi:hypothetical protein